MRGIRIHGDIFGLSEEAFRRLGRPPFDEVVFADGVLRIDHEGYADVEGFLAELAPLLGEDGHGRLDLIDKPAWEMTRYVVGKGGWSATRVAVDNVMETLMDEAGA